ncbi:hypothetical protein GXW82_32890 [Streptacidiphilus sp. 4-A2]|nr:hypothetical protein [Streptacidiphilus sp. 4-A2]
MVTDRDGRVVHALCWAYRLIEPTGRSLLVLAADATRLRAVGPRLALGNRMLRYTSATPTAQPGLQLSVSGVRLPATDGTRPDGADGSGIDRLAPMLPRAATERRRRLLDQIAAAGAPGLLVDGTVLPVQPYLPKEGAAAQAGDGSPLPAEAATVPGHHPGPAPALLPTALPTPLPTALPTPRSAPGDRPRRATAEDGPFSGPPSVPTLILSSSALPAAELPAAEPVNQQLRLLSHVGAQIGTTLDLDVTVRELCDVVVPSIADFACVDLRDRLIVDAELPRDRPDDETQLRRVARAFSESLAEWGSVVRVGSLLALPRNTPSGLALQTNQPVLVPQVDQEVAGHCAAGRGGATLVPLFAGRSMLTLPLAARGTVLGY